MAKNGLEGVTVKTILGEMPAEEFIRTSPEQRLLLKRPGWFAVSFFIAMAGVAGIFWIACKAWDIAAWVL